MSTEALTRAATGPAARTAAAPRRGRRRDPSAPLLRGWSVLVYLFLWLPILTVVVSSFNSGRRLAIWDGFGTDWYAVALGNQGIIGALRVSVVVAALTAVVAVVLGSLAGIALARRPGRWQRPFLAIVFLVLVIPEIVDGIAYLIFFVRIDLDLGLARLVVGHSVFTSAVVALVVRARLSGLDESLEEAAADLGASPFAAFRQVTLPLMLPAVLAGGLLAFTFSLDNVIISEFVALAGNSTLPVFIFSALRTGLKGDLAAISTLALLATLVALGAVAWVLRRSGDSAEEVTQTLTGA
jgi:ABC-type spermidine/putrescine transport system permease subunit II